MSDHLHRRLADVRLLSGSGSDQEFRQAINDLNHRVRYALGESDTALTSRPVL